MKFETRLRLRRLEADVGPGSGEGLYFCDYDDPEDVAEAERRADEYIAKYGHLGFVPIILPKKEQDDEVAI